MRSFSAPIEHGCLILRDENASSEHGDWEPGEAPYQAKRDSIIFSTIPSVEGMVEVKIWDGIPEDGYGEPYLAVDLHSDRGRVTIHDPNEDVLMVFRVKKGLNSVVVRADSVQFPRQLQVQFN
jgi:hypothetical protein